MMPQLWRDSSRSKINSRAIAKPSPVLFNLAWLLRIFQVWLPWWCSPLTWVDATYAQKFGWLQDYRTTSEIYTQMLALVRTRLHQLKQQGLTENSLTDFIKQTESLQLSPRNEAFKAKLLLYLEAQTASLPPEKSLLGSSDIIESLNGHV